MVVRKGNCVGVRTSIEVDCMVGEEITARLALVWAREVKSSKRTGCIMVGGTRYNMTDTKSEAITCYTRERLLIARIIATANKMYACI